MKRSAPVRFLILMFGLALVVFVAVFSLTTMLGKKSHTGVSLGRDKIAVVDIKGIIMGSERILESLDRFTKDRNVKGIIFRIDSPGGAVAPSQEIYSAIKKIQEKGEKKTVAAFGNVAASGAYYLATAADRIISNPGTITGSIGVIMEMSNFEKLLDKVGIESYVLKSGKYKDIGSVTRPMSEEEKQILQSVLDDVYMQFVEDVAEGRGMELEKVKNIANGSIFSGRQALGIGLVDQLGSFQDAVDLVVDLSGIEGEPFLIYEKDEKMNWVDYFTKSMARELFQGRLRTAPSGALYLMQ
jgi:protease-4